jgi:hypothetical protein
MEFSLQPQAAVCFVTRQPFEDGLRVASYLVRMPESGEIARRDLLESEQASYQPEGPVLCRWVRAYKKRAPNENPERELKLTAESLFVTLADPATERTEDTTRLLQFLALLLERKRVLRPKGRTADGARQVFEHARSKEFYEVPSGELTPEFFAGVQEQLGVLVGGK